DMPVIQSGRLPREPLERVRLQEFEAAAPREAVAGDPREPPVLLDGEDLRSRGQQLLGERSESRADLENAVAGSQSREAHDAADLVRVVEEVLAEGSRQTRSVRGENLAHLAECHFCGSVTMRLLRGSSE